MNENKLNEFFFLSTTESNNSVEGKKSDVVCRISDVRVMDHYLPTKICTETKRLPGAKVPGDKINFEIFLGPDVVTHSS